MEHQASLKSKALLHPVRSQLFVLLHSGPKTAQELCEMTPGVPAGSVYRHLNILLEAEFIVISEEVKQRGALLRRFAVNTLVEKFSHEDMDAMDNHAVVTVMRTMLSIVESKGNPIYHKQTSH
jgi:DNA-binding transcriptional ArsR family regulator